MKIFLAWEVNLFIKYLDNYGFLDSQKLKIIESAFLLKTDMTVNHARKILARPNHPDPTRGAMYIWEEETPNENTDYKVPYAWRQYFESQGVNFTQHPEYDADEFEPEPPP